MFVAAACGSARGSESGVVARGGSAPAVIPSGVPELAPVTPTASASASPTQASSAAVSPSPSPPVRAKSSFWGDPVAVENFDGPLPGEWGKYDTPDSSPPRSADMVSVSGGQLHLTGGVDARLGKDVGAGVMFVRDFKYGRFEVRFRVQAGAGYAPDVLLWPKNNDDWPTAGEIDLAEMNDPARAGFGSFLHHGKDNNIVGHHTKADFTRFHTIAVDWLPTRVTYYLDGKKIFNVTPGQIKTGLPTESVMHLALQLDQGCGDLIPCRNANTPARVVMDVDWVKVYRAPQS